MWKVLLWKCEVLLWHCNNIQLIYYDKKLPNCKIKVFCHCVQMTKDGIDNYIVVQVDYSFTIMAYDCLVYYIIFRILWMSFTLFNRINIMYMTTSLSRRLNILCIMFFIIIQFSRSYTMVGILLPCVKHSHNHIILLKGEVLEPHN
jgi:hypothetical protein